MVSRELHELARIHFEMRNGFAIVPRSWSGRCMERLFSFADGDVHDDGGGNVFAEAASLEAFELVHGAIELTLQGAFVTDYFFQELTGGQQGDGAAHGVLHVHLVLPYGD